MSLHPNSELGCNICSMLHENTLSIDNSPRHRWLHFGHEAIRIKVTQARLHFRRPPYGSSLILAFRADPLIHETHVLLNTISFFPCFPNVLNLRFVEERTSGVVDEGSYWGEGGLAQLHQNITEASGIMAKRTLELLGVNMELQLLGRFSFCVSFAWPFPSRCAVVGVETMSGK